MIDETPFNISEYRYTYTYNVLLLLHNVTYIIWDYTLTAQVSLVNKSPPSLINASKLQM